MRSWVNSMFNVLHPQFSIASVAMVMYVVVLYHRVEVVVLCSRLSPCISVMMILNFWVKVIILCFIIMKHSIDVRVDVLGVVMFTRCVAGEVKVTEWVEVIRWVDISGWVNSNKWVHIAGWF